MEESRSEKRIDKVFIAGVIIKSLQGLIEIIGGGVLIFINNQALVSAIKAYTHEELVENPHDLISIFLSYIGQHVLSKSTLFVVIYLLSHGLIKLFLIAGLFHKKLWAYYVFIWFLISFIVYQAYRYSLTRSPMLLILPYLIS